MGEKTHIFLRWIVILCQILNNKTCIGLCSMNLISFWWLQAAKAPKTFGVVAHCWGRHMLHRFTGTIL